MSPTVVTAAGVELEQNEIVLHGHRVTYCEAGEGPVVVLLHGITSSSATWHDVVPLLSPHYKVIAPDLLGHGQSAKPIGDYSLGAYASGVRDLLLALGHEQATIVGHSLGGGIAMQLAYQFPERAEWLVLVDSGGLGREVNLLLRAAALPGAELVLPQLVRPGLRDAGAAVGGALSRLGLVPGPDLRGIGEGFASLHDDDARRAFLHTVRSIIDLGGQRVSAVDRLYLAEEMPFLIVWGERDPMIPVKHAYRAHEEVPHSRLEVFRDAGHFPFNDDPVRFAGVLHDFIEGTEPFEFDEFRMRELLKGR